jgi:hypothetical protein
MKLLAYGYAQFLAHGWGDFRCGDLGGVKDSGYATEVIARDVDKNATVFDEEPTLQKLPVVDRFQGLTRSRGTSVGG